MLFASVFIASVIVLLGLFVIVRDGKKIENKIFFVVTILSALWATNFYFIDKYPTITLVNASNILSYIFGAALMFAAVSFTYFFPRSIPRRSLYIYSVPLVIISVLAPTSLLNGTVSGEPGNYEFNEGPLGVVYIAILLMGVGLIYYNLLSHKKGLNALQSSQSKTLAQGFTLSFIFGLFLAMGMPLIDENSAITNLSPFSVLFFVLFTVVAISKHKLFDFRSVLIRAVSYIVVTGLVTTAYVSIFFLARRIIFPGSSVSAAQLISNIAVGIMLVATYPTIKKYFDKVTNKLFFRDAYDPQVLIDRLNQTLVTNVELEQLLTKSALILQEELKTEFCTFFIRKTPYLSDRVIGAHLSKTPEFDDIDEIQALAPKTKRKVIYTDQINDTADEKQLSKYLKNNNIEILGRLVNTLEYEVNGIGYMFLGPKKSGAQYTNQDIRLLETIANELVIAIENVLRFEEIEQFNVTLQKKIDDATKELKSTNEKLRALDEAKDEFVSMASHQLRTPLTSIKGYLSMVLEGDAGKITDTQKDMLGQAFFSSQRMVYLISDLLNVSRLKTGKFIIEPKPVYLPDLVEDEINQLLEGAKAKNLTLSFTKPKQFPTLNLDDMKIRQVVMNFTDNAIYYTQSGGKITVALKETPQSVEFTVTDSGIGVPKEQQPKLFTKFYRADNARKARPDGTGLGLFMAKKVIIAQGGSIIFASKEGKGSTFGFSFPKEKLLVSDDKSSTPVKTAATPPAQKA